MQTIKRVALFTACALISACSISMALHQPDKKNFGVFKEGTPQQAVRQEFGLPVWSGKDAGGHDTDVFQFVQGYSKGAKTARAMGHGVADVFTLGLWEIVGTPTEAIADGTKINATITYDDHDLVKAVKLSDENGKGIPLNKS